jgi:hypothetical protein
MAGTLTISTLSDGTNSTSATNPIKGSAKAWCQYNATTQTIAGSYNISSVTYLSTGQYTFNFTNAMPNTAYAVVGGAPDVPTGATNCRLFAAYSVSTGSFSAAVVRPDNFAYYNSTYTYCAVFSS